MYHICKLVFFFFFLNFTRRFNTPLSKNLNFLPKNPKQNLASETLANRIFSVRCWDYDGEKPDWNEKSQDTFFFFPSFHSSRGLMNFVLILPLLFQHMTAVAISKGMLRSHKSDPQQQCRQSLLKFHPLSWKEKRLALKPSFRNSFSWLNIIAKVIQYKRQFNPLLAITSSSVVVVARARNHSLSSVHISRHVCEPVFV